MFFFILLSLKSDPASLFSMQRAVILSALFCCSYCVSCWPLLKLSFFRHAGIEPVPEPDHVLNYLYGSGSVIIYGSESFLPKTKMLR